VIQRQNFQTTVTDSDIRGRDSPIELIVIQMEPTSTQMPFEYCKCEINKMTTLARGAVSSLTYIRKSTNVSPRSSGRGPCKSFFPKSRYTAAKRYRRKIEREYQSSQGHVALTFTNNRISHLCNILTKTAKPEGFRNGSSQLVLV
jgi:hypothetical protein